jgi:hypothetical protein
MLKSHGLFVKPVTNGTLLKKYAQDVVDSRVDAIHASVDTDRERHNFVRQAEWAYDRTVEGLAAVNEARRRAGRHTPLLVINFTMSRHNAAASVRKLCTELMGLELVDVLSIKASPIWMPRKKGEAYHKLVARYFGVNGITSWKGFVEDYSDFDDGAREVAEDHRRLETPQLRFLRRRAPAHRRRSNPAAVYRLQLESRSHALPVRRADHRCGRECVSVQPFHRIDAATTSAAAPRRGNRWQIALMVLGALLFVGIIWRANPRRLLETLSAFGIGFVLIVARDGISDVFHALATRYCFSPGNRRAPLLSLLSIRYTVRAYNLLTPTSGFGGDFVKGMLLRRYAPAHEAASVVIIDKFTFGLTQFAMAFWGSAVVLTQLDISPGAKVAFWTVSALLWVGFACFLLLQRHGWLTPLLQRAARLLGGDRGRTWMAHNLEQLDGRLQTSYRSQSTDLLRAIFWQAVGSGTDIVLAWLFLYFLFVAGRGDVRPSVKPVPRAGRPTTIPTASSPACAARGSSRSRSTWTPTWSAPCSADRQRTDLARRCAST